MNRDWVCCWVPIINFILREREGGEGGERERDAVNYTYMYQYDTVLPVVLVV